MNTYNDNDCIIVPYKRKITCVTHECVVGSSVQIEKLEQLIHEHVGKFEPYIHDYNLWISIAFRMATTGVSYDCFRAVSALDADKS